MNDSHQIIDDDENANNHVMGGYPYLKCLTHKDCHLNSFYPGKLYRAMEMEKNEDGILKMKKKAVSDLV